MGLLPAPDSKIWRKLLYLRVQQYLLGVVLSQGACLIMLHQDHLAVDIFLWVHRLSGITCSMVKSFCTICLILGLSHYGGALTSLCPLWNNHLSRFNQFAVILTQTAPLVAIGIQIQCLAASILHYNWHWHHVGKHLLLMLILLLQSILVWLSMTAWLCNEVLLVNCDFETRVGRLLIV